MDTGNHSSWAVLPNGGQPHLFQITGEKLEPLLPLPCSSDAWFHLDGDRLAAVDQASKRVQLFRIGESGDLKPVWPATAAPQHHKIQCILPVGDQLYVGGVDKGRRKRDEPRPCNLHRVDAAGWHEVRAPEGGTAKHIDGLALQGSRLIAVDDLVMPKWNLVFDVEDPAAPVFLSRDRLPWHTSYETVTHTAFNGAWLALWSRGINHGNGSGHLSLLRLEDLKEMGCRRYRVTFSKDPDEERKANVLNQGTCQGLVFRGDRLYAVLDGHLQVFSLDGLAEAGIRDRIRMPKRYQKTHWSERLIAGLGKSSCGRHLFAVLASPEEGCGWLQLPRDWNHPL
jgi:hypothetical protein